MKSQVSKDLQRFPCPPQIGITKSRVGNLDVLKYRNRLSRLLKLLLFIQSTVVVMHIAMHSDFSAIPRNFINQLRVPCEYYCRNEESWRSIIGASGVNYRMQRIAYTSFSKPETCKYRVQTPDKVMRTLCLERISNKIHFFTLQDSTIKRLPS